MLTHGAIHATSSSRVAILGAGGFVGKAVVAWFARRRVPTLALTRNDLDLLKSDAAADLASRLQSADTLVVISAKAPVKNHDMLLDNLRMMSNVCAALQRMPVAHLLYVSSDAVYADSDASLSERSCAQPASLHGAMHLTREIMLQDGYKDSLCIVRPTLIYGADDPHNGYGPNRFRRLANSGQDIVLFGNGEEQRDHVFIDDVAELIGRCVLQRSRGILNIATGQVHSFNDIAERVVSLSPVKVSICPSPRIGEMPHRGYRSFDPTQTMTAFPDFQYTTLDDGLAQCQQHMKD